MASIARQLHTQLIDSELNTYDKFTELQRLRFNFGEGKFLYKTPEGGIIGVGNEFFRHLSTSAGARKVKAGATTLKRAAFTNTLVQATSGEARRNILAEITRQLHTELITSSI